MKRTFLLCGLFCLMAAAPVLTSCSDDEDTPKPEVKPTAGYGTFVGEYKAFLADGTLSKSGSAQTMRLLKGSASDTLYMDQISFTDKVPYAFDIRFDGLVLSADGKTLRLAESTRVPEMIWKGQWTPMPAYTISAFSGHISADSLYLDFKCGENHLEYAGKYSGK